MFIHPLKEDGELMEVGFANYAKRHFLRRFEKNYRGAQWDLTLESINEDLGRMRVVGKSLQNMQKVDELWYKNNKWIFKYDFKIAKTKISTKASGNRCVAFLDAIKNTVTILLIFGKGDLPKNMGEQAFIEKTLREEFVGMI